MKTQTVLLVEADVIVRHPLAEYLRECGYTVLEAVDFQEARDYFGGASIAIDVVLADTDAPGGGGFALASWIRENHPAVRVIMAGSVPRAVENAREICHDGPEVTKPYDHRLVLERIKRSRAAARTEKPPPR